MAAIQSYSATGTVTALGENAFRLTTDHGQTLNLTLDDHLRVTRGDLMRWENMKQRVQVEYLGDPQTGTGVVMAVKPLA